jgi:molybdopterin-guanine dinucleotide biosynthesis protein B
LKEKKTDAFKPNHDNQPQAFKVLPGKKSTPLIAIVGHSGSGKTTLIEKLIHEMTALGFKVGTIKHHIHGFEMDQPGKDSWRHKQAGASTTIISSPHGIGMVMDVDHDHELDELLSMFGNVDLILAEGYKRSNKPKIEIFRPVITPKPLCKKDDLLIAMVTDADISINVPTYSPNDIPGIASLLISLFALDANRTTKHREAIP